MSNFTPLVERTYEFEGDTVKVVFSRLRRKDMLAAMPAFKRLNDLDEDAPERMEAVNDILNDIADSLPNYVKEVSGLTASDGSAVDIKTIVEEMYFMKLCAEIATDVMSESSAQGGNV